jgi:hypothetical protein
MASERSAVGSCHRTAFARMRCALDGALGPGRRMAPQAAGTVSGGTTAKSTHVRRSSAVGGSWAPRRRDDKEGLCEPNPRSMDWCAKRTL